MKKAIIIIAIIIALIVNATWRSIVPGTWVPVTVCGWTIESGDGTIAIKVETYNGDQYWYNASDVSNLHVGDEIQVKFTQNGRIINDRW